MKDYVGNYFFIPEQNEVFKIVKVSEQILESNEVVVLFEKENKTKRVNISELIEVGSLSEIENPPTDLIKLIHVNQASILHTLKSRFLKDQIYTSIGPILVALNPFKWVEGIYSEDLMNGFKDNSLNLSDNPHVFAITQDAYIDLTFGQNQSMIIR